MARFAYRTSVDCFYEEEKWKRGETLDFGMAQAGPVRPFFIRSANYLVENCPQYVGVYWHKEGSRAYHSDCSHDYVFCVGAKEELISEKEGFKLISLKRTPRFIGGLQVKEQTRERLNPIKMRGYFGHIYYDFIADTKTAIPNFYYPKSRLSKGDGSGTIGEKTGIAPGLGTYLENICANHLQRQGVEYVRTGFTQSGARKAQLWRLGIYGDARLPIREWKRRLRQGIAFHVRRKGV